MSSSTSLLPQLRAWTSLLHLNKLTPHHNPSRTLPRLPPLRPRSVTSPPNLPLQLLAVHSLPPQLTHSPGVSLPLLHLLLHSHHTSPQEVTTQQPLILTSPGTALRPISGMGIPAPFLSNFPTP